MTAAFPSTAAVLLALLAVCALASTTGVASAHAAAASSGSALPAPAALASLPQPPAARQGQGQGRRRRRRGRGPYCTRPKLVCAFRGTAGNPSVSGSAVFESVRRGSRCVVRVRALVRGLSPGAHGFHIHAFGDVRGADGKSAGGHFVGPWNRGAQHGWPWSRNRHWGCLGNINAPATPAGPARYDRLDKMIRIGRIVGRSMVIHAGPDKGPQFQPSGASGPRVAYCVIGYANPDFNDEL